jgi:hypothetical protein
MKIVPSRIIASAALAASLGACTWVPMQTGASAVRVFATGAAPAGCSKLGEIEVEVTDKVAFYARNPVRVREELETMARNEALGLGADAIQPMAEPREGSQRFSGWRCGRA